MFDKEKIEDAQKLFRKLMWPGQEAKIESFHKTAYCMTRGCPHNDYFDCHSEESSGTLRSKDDLKKFQKCHTIPKAAQLNAIATDKKAIWVPMRPGETLTKKPFFSIEAIKNILTFKGFCNSCDSKLFKPIDKPIEMLDIESSFLLAYRAFCYRAWRNEVDANSEELHLTKLIDSGAKNIDVNRESINVKLTGAKKSRLEQKTINAQIANLFQIGIKNKFFGQLRTQVFCLNSNLPFRYSCATPMTRNLLWKLQPMNWEDCILTPMAFLSFLKIGGKDSLVVSWFDYVPNKFANEYLDVIRDVSDNGDLSDVLVQFSAINNYGFSANPEWVSSWKPEMQLKINESIRQYAYQNEEIEELEVGKNWLTTCKIESEKSIELEDYNIEKLATNILENAKLDFEIEFNFSKNKIKSLKIIGHKLMQNYYAKEKDNDSKENLKISTEFLRVTARLGWKNILSINSWNIFGRSVFNTGHYVSASKAFEFAINNYKIEESNESFANFLEGYHSCLMALRNTSKAIKIGQDAIVMYEELIKTQSLTVLIPTMLNLLFNQMTVFYWSDETEEMITTGIKGLKLMKENQLEVSPSSAGIYNNLTVAYVSLNDYLSAFDSAKLALTEYEKLAESNPDFLNEYLDFKERFKVFDDLPKISNGTSKFHKILNEIDAK